MPVKHVPLFQWVNQMDAELSQYNLRNIHIIDTKIVDFTPRTSVVETVPRSEPAASVSWWCVHDCIN